VIIPGIQRDASGLAKVTLAAGGGTPAHYVGGFALDATMRLLGDTDAPAGAFYRGGFRVNANGVPYVDSSAQAGDITVNGYRATIVGALVLAVEGTPQQVVAGEPRDVAGSLCVTEL
jgi:hypothetical protein